MRKPKLMKNECIHINVISRYTTYICNSNYQWLNKYMFGRNISNMYDDDKSLSVREIISAPPFYCVIIEDHPYLNLYLVGQNKHLKLKNTY